MALVLRARAQGKRVYTCQLDGSAISTRFADWVETDLLKIGSSQVRKITFDNYKVRIDQDEARVERGEIVNANRDASGTWTLDGGVPAGYELEKEKLDTANSTLSSLTLVGVRRKPAGLLDAISKYEKRQIGTGIEAQKFIRDLQRRLGQLASIGFFPAPNEQSGKLRILSNEGEVRVACDDGVVYTLRMGDILMGEPDDLAGAATTQPAAKSPATAPTTQPGREHRYVFVTVDFDESLLGDKPAAGYPADEPAVNPAGSRGHHRPEHRPDHAARSGRGGISEEAGRL